MIGTLLHSCCLLITAGTGELPSDLAHLRHVGDGASGSLALRGRQAKSGKLSTARKGPYSVNDGVLRKPLGSL